MICLDKFTISNLLLMIEKDFAISLFVAWFIDFKNTWSYSNIFLCILHLECGRKLNKMF